MSQPDFFGINPTFGNFKIASLSSAGDRYRLESIGLINQLDSSQNIIQDIYELDKDFLRGQLSKLGIRSNNCIISLPEQKVISRQVTIPILKEDEVENAIYFAFKPLISVDIDLLNVSYIQTSQDKQGNLATYYVVGTEKELVLKYYNFFKDSGINLLAVETETLANARLTQYNLKLTADEDYMIVDLGANSTTITLNNLSNVLYSQILTSAGKSMTKLISADFAVDIAQAEQYKNEYGFDQSFEQGKIAISIRPVIDNLLAEILKVISFHHERISMQRKLSNIFLVGGGAELKGLDIYFSQTTNILCSRLEIFKNIDIKNDMKKGLLDKTNISRFSVAIGLCLKKE